MSTTTLESIEEDKRLKQHFAQPLAAGEMFSSTYATKEAGADFFAPRQIALQKSTTTTTTVTMTVEDDSSTRMMDFCRAVTAKIDDASFVKEHENSRAPLAMLAFAGVVVDHIIRGKKHQVTKC